MLPRPLKGRIWGFRLGAPHKVDLLRRPANSYKNPAKPQMYAHTHAHTHTHTHARTQAHTHTHTHTHTHAHTGTHTHIVYAI